MKPKTGTVAIEQWNRKTGVEWKIVVRNTDGTFDGATNYKQRLTNKTKKRFSVSRRARKSRA